MPKCKKSTGSTLSQQAAPSSDPLTTLVTQVTRMENTLSSLVSWLTTLESQVPLVPPQPASSPATENIVAASIAPSRSRSHCKKITTTGSVLGPTTTVTALLLAHHPRSNSPNCYSASLVLADDLMGHVVGHGGRGLKQTSDISGAHLSAFSQKIEGCKECLITIRGTELQIGNALVVIGKCMARKRVHIPKKKGDKSPPVTAPTPVAPTTEPVPQGGSSSTPWPRVVVEPPPSSVLAPPSALSLAPPSLTSTLQPSLSTSTPAPCSTPTTPLSLSHQVSGSGSPMALSTPSGTGTLAVPSVQMATPSSSGALMPMDVNHILVLIGATLSGTPTLRRLEAICAWEHGYVIWTFEGWVLPEGDEDS